MMANSTAQKRKSLLRLVEERALSKREKNEQHNVELVPYLPKECVSNVLNRLPIDSIQRSSSVCKQWYKIINNPHFIDGLLHRSETVLIFLTGSLGETSGPFSMKPIPKPNTFSIEDSLCQSQFGHPFPQSIFEARSKFYIQFMEIKDGKGKIGEFNATCFRDIRASCNGLIVLDNEMKKGGLIVMNPVTRKLIMLPVGTLSHLHRESYGLAFCSTTRNYKLVHLFRDKLQYVGCEILIIGTRSWKEVDGPPFGLLRRFGLNPVSAIGALHWIPRINHSEYLVSMILEDEKFRKVLLPKAYRTHDRIVEMGELLSFVTHEEPNQIDIWILRSLNEEWIKQHSITLNCLSDMVPLCCTRITGEMIFRDANGSFYIYNFEMEVMKRVEIESGVLIGYRCLPHVNSLVSWQSSRDVGDL